MVTYRGLIDAGELVFYTNSNAQLVGPPGSNLYPNDIWFQLRNPSQADGPFLREQITEGPFSGQEGELRVEGFCQRGFPETNSMRLATGAEIVEFAAAETRLRKTQDTADAKRLKGNPVLRRQLRGILRLISEIKNPFASRINENSAQIAELAILCNELRQALAHPSLSDLLPVPMRNNLLTLEDVSDALPLALKDDSTFGELEIQLTDLINPDDG